jgi:fatty acid desaturase
MYSMAFCSVLTLESLLFLLLSRGTDFLRRAKAELTAWTLLLSLAFLLWTRWAGFSLWGMCLYWVLGFSVERVVEELLPHFLDDDGF